MAKSKSDKKEAALSKPVDSVKKGRITKPSGDSKAESKKLAKETAAKISKLDGKSTKKTKRAPSPDSEAESGSASDSASASDSSSGSDSSSESESEVETRQSNIRDEPKLSNGVNKKDNSSSDSESGSDSESDSGSDSESASDAVAGNPEGVPTNGINGKVPAGGDSNSGSSSGSESDSEGDSESDSDSASEKEAPIAKKRKADSVEPPLTKKPKPSAEAVASNPVHLFVGNLSWAVDDEWLQREFSEYGEVVGCRLITDRDSGRSKGYGYVDFATPEQAAAALEAKKGVELDGRPLNVDFATPRKNDAFGGGQRDRANSRAESFGDAKSPPSDTLFVANIAFGASAEDLQEAFSEFGTITRVSIPTDRDSGQPKGFGYVGFSSIDESKAAFGAMNGAEIAGRPIRLDYASARPDRGDVNGFRGGRGGFNDRGRGGRGGRGGFNDRGGRGGGRGGFGDRGRGRGAPRGMSSNRGGVGDFSGKKISFD